MKPYLPPLLLVLLTSTFATLSVTAELTPEQRKLPLEADAPDPSLVKIVLLAGSTSNKTGQHEYFAGCALLAQWLRNTQGVWPVLVADGWPQNEAVLEGAKAVVLYADGGPKFPFLAPERWNRIKTLVDKGTGLVLLHQSVDIPEDRAVELQQWMGGAWQKDIGCRGHWDMDFDQFPKHPSLNGVTAFAAPMDGWLYNLHFSEGVIPLLSGAVPEKSRSTPDARAHEGRAEVVAWAYERPSGGRSFAYTGCDLHRNWSVESQRRLVTNGILWSANVPVPAEGATVTMQPTEITANMDAKPSPTSTPSPVPVK
jgi:hypothetical protein